MRFHHLLPLTTILCIFAAASFAAEPRLPAPVGWPAPEPAPALPAADFVPPIDATAPVADKAPRFFEHTKDAGPDHTFFAIGAGFTGELYAWGVSANSTTGQSWALKTQLSKDAFIAATIPERAFDGPFLIWARNANGWSRPIRINVPQPWFCWPNPARPGDVVQIAGQNLSPRPDGDTAYVYLAQPAKPGQWLPAQSEGQKLRAKIPLDHPPGEYQLWVHAGRGGSFAWGSPLKLTIQSARPAPPAHTILDKSADPDHLQKLLDDLARKGGGTLLLREGVFPVRGTLRVPADVRLLGDAPGPAGTRIQTIHDTAAHFQAPSNIGWNKGPSSIHTPGDTIEYNVDFPADGNYVLWLRYATEMAQYKLAGVSKHMSAQIDDGPFVPLDNLPNTGSFGTFKWSKSATIQASAGRHVLRWRNDKGGGITLDAFALTRDPELVIPEKPMPESSDKLLVIQAETPVKFTTRQGQLPFKEAPVIWLAGDRAAVRNLTVVGNPQTNIGVLIAHQEPLKTVVGCEVEQVKVINLEGKFAEICGVRVNNASHTTVRRSHLAGRAPLFLSGAYRCIFEENKLETVTRFGGNAEAVILSRCERLEECVIAKNLVVSPDRAQAGGPTGRRLIWISTGRGSISHNYIAHNGVDTPATPGADVGAPQARFGGVAGTDQNVGEMILFEANHRTMFFGQPASADTASVTLPRTIPATPDTRLGSVKREQLAHDEKGNETPFWPPDDFDDSPEPPIHQYYVTIFAGPGQGQTRRVLRRENEKLILDRPWSHAPDHTSTLTVGTAFYQNTIAGNYTPDGMTGVQLWISCIENIVSGNTIARQRKPGVFLYSSGTTLASSMPRTWNRGISPLFFNHIEGTRATECSAGALVTSGDARDLPVEFPRGLGNVLRHNSFEKCRTDGVVVVSRAASPQRGDTSPSILGTIAEFNVVRDALVGYHAAAGSDAIVLRRNHAYFWYPVAATTQPTIGIQIDPPDATIAIELNSIEGKHGTGEAATIPIKQPATQPVRK